MRRTTLRQSKLRVLDLGSNHFSTLPKALLKNSPRLNTVYLDNNRLLNCSQMHVLRRAGDLELVDLSENRLVRFERACFDALVSGVTVKLTGNPFQCSCETAAVAQWLNTRHRGPEIADGDSLTCTGPPQLSGTQILHGSHGSLPGWWECHRPADIILAVVVILGGLTVLVLVVIAARRRLMLLRLGRTNTSPTRAAQNGSISSVTISNSCYGNGVTSDAASNVGVNGETLRRYSRLIEDDDDILQRCSTSYLAQRPSDHQQQQVDRDVHQPTADTCCSQTTTPSCREIDSEALLAYYATETMEQSV